MSTPLGHVSLWVGASLVGALAQARLGDLSVTNDLLGFRAPFGARWHHAALQQLPTLQQVSGVASSASLPAIQAALPHVTRLGMGAWLMPVMGAAGPVTIVPVLQGYRITAEFVIDVAAPWEADP